MGPVRRWWKQGSHRHDDDDDDDDFSLPAHDDLQPMDTQDQERMIRLFESKMDQQSLLWRSVFGGFLVGYAVFLVYSVFQQVWFPWELRYHAYFMDEIHTWAIISADWIAALACLLAVKGLLHSSESYRRWLWYSCYTALLLAVFWLYHMLRLPKFQWPVIWLPFGPLIGAGICIYVDHLLKESREDVRKLRNYMYNYKAI